MLLSPSEAVGAMTAVADIAQGLRYTHERATGHAIEYLTGLDMLPPDTADGMQQRMQIMDAFLKGYLEEYHNVRKSL